MRKIAIINQKGGVGKTTTTVNLGCGIAKFGKHVVMIDLDPQAHLTMHLGIEPDSELPNIYNVLTGSASLEEILKQVSENVLVAPSTIDLAGAEIELASTVGREVILRDAIEEYTKEYDFLLMDCPPSLGLPTINALCTADEIFITSSAREVQTAELMVDDSSGHKAAEGAPGPVTRQIAEAY